MTNGVLLRRLTFGLLLATLNIVGYAQPALTPSVLEAERVRFHAQISRDTSALRAGIHPELLMIHSNGREESADDLIASVASGDIVYQQFEARQPPRVLTFGSTALVDSTVRVTGLYQGQAFSLDLRYTSVYRRVQGRWLLIRWQSLKV